jgi:hypothetical protein
VTAHPDAKFLFSCCDFTAPITVPAVKQAGGEDVVHAVAYDNLSTLKLIRDGAPVITTTANGDVSIATAVDQILAHKAKDADIDPKADDGKYKYKVVDKANVPPDGQFVFDPKDTISEYSAKWKSEYGL